MNKAFKITALSMLAAAAVLTAACSKTQTDNSAHITHLYGTTYNDGELIVTNDAKLSFLQYSDMETIIMCNQINCEHINYTTDEGLPCLAYGKENLPFLSGEKLYWLINLTETQNGKPVDYMELHSSDPFGTLEKTICRIDGLSCDWTTESCIKNNTLMFFPYESVYDENGAKTDEMIYHFGVLDISSGKFTDFGATEDNQTALLGMYDNKLYFNNSVYDMASGEIAENKLVHDAVSVRMTEKYYAYNTENSVEIITPDKEENIILRGEKISYDCMIVGDLLFQKDENNWYYYDLSADDPVKKNINYKTGVYAQVVAEYEDSFILNVLDPDTRTVVKEKAAKSDILGV